MSSSSKVVSLKVAAERARQARRLGNSVVFTNGCFDLFHLGHLRSLEAARAEGDLLIVGVNRDASVRELKGSGRPIVPENDRMELLAGLSCVDWVVGFSATTPLELIQRLRPDVLAKGGDWDLEDIVGRREVESWGGRIVRLKIAPGRSTTETIERIQRGSARNKR